MGFLYEYLTFCISYLYTKFAHPFCEQLLVKKGGKKHSFEVISCWLPFCYLQAKGLGYAMNTSEELKFVKEIAQTTGVILDPVYRYELS